MVRARRRVGRVGRARPLVTIVACLAATAVLVAAAPGSAERLPTQADAGPDPELVAEGRRLYLSSCVTCHGADGQGLDAPNGAERGPSLTDAGEAGAYYWLTTGRMPLANPGDTPMRKDPAFDDAEIEALVAFVASLGDGPELPGIDVERGDLAEGGVLYRENCQACHSATGSGGALSYGRAAPSLAAPTPEQVGAAVRHGPGPMPQFGPEILPLEDLNSIARYVEYLEEPDDRGGLALGRLGPIPEGFMVWVGGLGTLLVAAFWMGKRWPTMETVDPVPPGEDPVTNAAEVSTEPEALVAAGADEPDARHEDDDPDADRQEAGP
jgi:ubiquinol-cytochrome c reductase cytochrome c subunit